MKRYRARSIITALLVWRAIPTPIALHQLIEVTVGGEVVLNLSGYNSGNDDVRISKRRKVLYFDCYLLLIAPFMGTHSIYAY